MTQYSNSGSAFGARPAEALDRTPNVAVRNRQIVRTMPLVGMIAIALSVVLLVAGPAQAFPFGAYQFREVVSTTGQFSFIGTPAINELGTIAAVYRLDAGGQQVLTQNDIIADTNDPSGDFTSFRSQGVTVNNSGTVAFSTGNRPDTAIFASSGGLITRIVDGSGFSIGGTSFTGSVDDFWDLGDNGDVIFGFDHDPFFIGRSGIYERNVSGGGVSRRIEAAETDFTFENPVVNNQGKIALLMSFRDGPVNQTTREQILSDFGTFMDTNDEFDLTETGTMVVSTMDMNNANTVAFLSELDNGFMGIFTSKNGESPIMVVDTSGPFDELSAPSINISGTTAFLATFDVGNGKGIFRGPNPITDKIIAVGDVFQTKGGATRTITDITGFGNDSFSKFGRVAFTVVDENGDRYLVSGAHALTFDFDQALLTAQLTTGMSNKKTMTQQFTLPSFAQTELQFDYRILTPGAEVVAYINDIEVGRVLRRSMEPMEEFETKVIPINPLALFGEFLPEILTLKLEIGDGPGTTVQLDNIVFADIVNGDFSTGDLTGWQFDDGGGAALVTHGFDPVFVPEPATLALLAWAGVIGVATRYWRSAAGPRKSSRIDSRTGTSSPVFAKRAR